MKIRKWLNKFIGSGLWTQPLVMYVLVWAGIWSGPPNYADSAMWSCLLLSVVPGMLIFVEKAKKPSAEKAMRGREKAIYPEVSARLLYEEPNGIVFGRFRNKYVCRPLSADGHCLVIGGSGCGKSSCIVIPTILANTLCRIFAIDVKGELSQKAVRRGDPSVCVLNPTDRTTWGYDPLYGLGKDSREQEILEVMQNIAISLIPLSASVKDPFWILSARNLLIGLLIYYYEQGTQEFVDIIDKILSRPVGEAVQDVMTSARRISLEYRYLVEFSAMAEDTLGGIVAEMNNHIIIFANDQNIRYAFKDNSRRANPRMLDEGCSVYLAVPEEKLAAYYDVIQLILTQTLAEMEKRPEDSEPILMLIDEFPRLVSSGRIERLLDGLRTLRSRKVCLMIVTQSMEAMMTAYSEYEVADIASNCPYIVVLSATSTKTQKQIVEWCGKYREQRQSWSGNGSDRRITISYEEKDIVQPSDLMTLQNTGEEILISPYGYYRIQKAPYYEDPVLGAVARKILQYNDTADEILQRNKITENNRQGKICGIVEEP